MNDPRRRAAQAIFMLRLVIAGLLAAHGWTRFLSGGVVPFGEWLGSQGLPFGFWIASAVTGYEIAGTVLLALGRWTSWLCLGFIAIYATGLVMVHMPEGWFVVGAGRNGMEYSVLLIVCLALIGWVNWPWRCAVGAGTTRSEIVTAASFRT